MANQQNWDDFGRSIQDAVDRAIKSQDYQKLNQTILDAVEQAVNTGSAVVRNVVDGFAGSNTKKLYAGTAGKTAKSALKVAGGTPLALVSSLTLAGSTLSAGPVTLGLLAPLFALLGVGLWLIGSGASMLGTLKRFKAYRRILGQKTFCSLDDLARRTGKPVGYVRKDLWRMIGKGLFLEGHMDQEEQTLITSNETYEYYEQSRLDLEARQKEAAEAAKTAAAQPRQDTRVQEVLDKGNAFIAQIRKCNDDIPGEEISAKIDRMELIVKKIFDRAKAHPEIVPDLKKLMDYYLPMTVKLLGAYADMDAQPVQGETIQKSKREIEATLDTLNQAYEKLLDSVFADTALDISSDISVLNTLLAQEGLAEDELTKMKKKL